MNDSNLQSIVAELDDQPTPARLKHLRLALVHLLSSAAPTRERIEAGRVLGHWGDPRSEVMTCEALELCAVPAGEFIFGEGHTQKKLNLPEFRISKNAITQAQFGQFVQAGGYAQPRYWPEAAQAGYWQAAGFKGHYDLDFRTAPPDYPEPFGLPNHPVAGVTWYEATAFTRWLNEQIHTWVTGQSGPQWQGLINAGLQIGLPTEEQWEKTARGPLIAQQKPRVYPWGAEFDPDKANTYPTGIGTTSAAGCFPQGASPYGALDLGGNVWEWTASPYNDACFVLRGGSCSGHSDYTRCSFRYKLNPDVYFVGTGFRVVAAVI
jgi:formylglycine-generating enzyme required for sulfatase activity